MSGPLVPASAVRLGSESLQTSPQQLSSFLGSPSFATASSPQAQTITRVVEASQPQSSSSASGSGFVGQDGSNTFVLNQAALHHTQVLNVTTDPLLVSEALAARKETAHVTAQAHHALEQAKQETLQTQDQAKGLVQQASQEVGQIKGQAESIVGQAFQEVAQVRGQAAHEVTQVRGQAAQEVEQARGQAAHEVAQAKQQAQEAIRHRDQHQRLVVAQAQEELHKIQTAADLRVQEMEQALFKAKQELERKNSELESQRRIIEPFKYETDNGTDPAQINIPDGIQSGLTTGSSPKQASKESEDRSTRSPSEHFVQGSGSQPQVPKLQIPIIPEEHAIPIYTPPVRSDSQMQLQPSKLKP